MITTWPIEPSDSLDLGSKINPKIFMGLISDFEIFSVKENYKLDSIIWEKLNRREQAKYVAHYRISKAIEYFQYRAANKKDVSFGN